MLLLRFLSFLVMCGVTFSSRTVRTKYLTVIRLVGAHSDAAGTALLPLGEHQQRSLALCVAVSVCHHRRGDQPVPVLTNVKQGGQPLAVALDSKMERLAIAAAKAVGAEIAGVDVLVAADGAPTVLEVNSMPAWSGVQKVSKRNIAEAIASALMDRIVARPAQRRAP